MLRLLHVIKCENETAILNDDCKSLQVLKDDKLMDFLV